MLQRVLHALAFFTAISATVASSASPESPVRGDGIPTEERRPAQGFEQIRAAGPYRLDVRRGASYEVTVSGDSNIVPLVRTRIAGRALTISVSQPIEPEVPLVVRLSLPSLTDLSVTGVVSADVAPFEGRELWTEVSGASTVRAGDLRYARLAANVIGGSSFDLSGHAEDVRISVVGASQLNGESFTSGAADIQVTGASRVALGPSGVLTGSVVGASSVQYGGPPESAAGLFVDVSSFFQILPR